MNRIETILVPTDFSPHARAAVDQSIRLAGIFGARIHLLHAIHLPVAYATPEPLPVPEGFTRDLREAALRKLEEAAAPVRGAGIPVESHLSEAPPTAAVLEAAESLEPDLIVIGTRGLSGLKHALLGSVAERTVRLAPCPVLTVAADAASSTEPRLKTVVVPTDFSAAADRALAYARDLARAAGPVHLILVHANFVPLEIEALAVRGPANLFEDIAARAEEGLERILVGLEDDGISAEYVAQRGSPEQVIAKLATDKRADLIVMGTRGRTGIAHVVLGSVAERVVRSALCPVLTVKPADD